MTTAKVLPEEPLSAASAALVEELADAMAARWRAGDPASVEEYLDGHPGLRDRPAAVLELLAEELTLREEFGRPADPADLRRRFPQWERHLAVLLDCHQLLSARAAAPRFPAAGESVGGFRLLHELGRGAQGRVFLATQPALADRPVVLKLTPAAGGEHLSLARLQHTHIVPLYSVHDFPERAVRGLCLPYFGGTTLAAVLQTLRDRPPSQRTGRQIWDALRAAGACPTPAAAGPVGGFLQRASCAEAVCWLGACLADALQYAHERGLVHLDLKPSNVLLTADGQPMLLDFHLARAPLPAGGVAPTWLGGTPEYMAPEHAAALAAVRRGQPIPVAVDGRADIHALGLLLAEVLAGAPAAGRFRSRAWQRTNPHVSTALADLLARCLAPDPAARYATAAAVAADLRRHLANLPLRGVANRNPAERWRKWRRRRPLALPAVILLVVGAVAGAGAIEHVRRKAEQARLALRQGTEYLHAGRYAEALESLKASDAALEDGWPFDRDVAGQLRQQRRWAEAGVAVGELHDVCERVRPLYGRADLPERAARAVASCCQDVWSRRDRVIRDLGFRPDLERQIRADLLDLAILWADLRVQLAGPGAGPTARHQALATLVEAEQLIGSSCVLAHEKRLLATATGLTDLADASARQAAALPPRSAWEHYAVGRAYLRAGDVAAAAAEMDRALELQPQALWPNYYKGSCAFRAGQIEDAVTAFSVCVALAPECAWCYFDRGLALAERGRAEAARADFDHALRLDPALTPAALNRGVLNLKLGRSAEALADFQLALDRGANAGTVYYQSALAHLALKDAVAARASLIRALACDPGLRPARDLLALLGPADR
jgi:tetratricopeptide (TPR) repeat protein